MQAWIQAPVIKKTQQDGIWSEHKIQLNSRAANLQNFILPLFRVRVLPRKVSVNCAIEFLLARLFQVKLLVCSLVLYHAIEVLFARLFQVKLLVCSLVLFLNFEREKNPNKTKPTTKSSRKESSEKKDSYILNI